MATFSNINLTNNPKFSNPTASINFTKKNILADKLKKLVSFKPILVSVDEISKLPDTSLDGFNNLGFNEGLVGYDTSSVDQSNKPMSPRITNWVGPYEINGSRKTLFYTEVNSGLKVGDRVFIINGNYDSDSLIKSNKYKKGRDGYKILYIDKCEVVLDIDYIGVLPYLEKDIDNFIKVFYVKNEDEFKWVNRQITTRGGNFDYKYNFSQNNIIYSEQNFNGLLSGWGINLGLTSGSGFYVRDDRNITGFGTYSWINITSPLINSGSYSYSLSPTYENNDRILIMGGSFNYNSNDFKEGFVYKWEVGPTQSTWVVDVKYSKPILTKGNFRDGNFDGIWNVGLFGRQDKKITWSGNKSTWNTGTLLNTLWKKGNINSNFTLLESYFSEIDEFGLPYQKINNPNNNGRGFNYLIDSEIISSTIENSSIINTIIGSGSSTYSIIENHILSNTVPFENIIKKAYFEDSEIKDVKISNSEVRNLRAINSEFDNVKSINSYYKKSLIKNSDYISDQIIKILNYDEFIMSESRTISSTFSSEITHKIYKFYIDKKSYNRFKNGDPFYIKGLNINDGTKKIQSFFDKKFKLGTWYEYDDNFYDTSLLTQIVPNVATYSFYKRGIDVGAFLSTPGDNEFQFTSIDNLSNYYTVTNGLNSKKDYSIDIVFSFRDINENKVYGLDFTNKIDITNAYIIDCDFDGVFEYSNWNSGFNYNFSNDNNITEVSSNGELYNLQVSTSSSTITATTLLSSLSWTKRETEIDYLKQNEVVFLDSVYYDTTGKVSDLLIIATGSSYSTGIFGVTGGSGLDLTINITSGLSGEIISATVSSGGIYYNIGDIITVNSGDLNAQLEVISVTGSNTRLPDTYKITSNINGVIKIKEINSSTISIFNTLLDGGKFLTKGAGNRWGYLNKTKITKSKIKSGYFKRSYLNQNLIQNLNLDLNDKDFKNLNQFKELIISESLFTDNKNILSKATYINSIFLNGSDTWDNGLFINSSWNGGTFSNGLIKESNWNNGVFNSGIFYSSRTFNANPTSSYPHYDVNNIRTPYKSGQTSDVIYNNRYSWKNGEFNSGEFIKSDWESGNFNNGKFYNSKWYSGIFNKGSIGNISLSTDDTKIYNGLIKSADVENAKVYAEDTSLSGLSQSVIIWENGTFNFGVFGSKIDTTGHSATWENGIFNGGEFITNASWKNGIFNGGKFKSGFGWTYSDTISTISTSQSQFSWQDGEFNGGEFGVGDTGTNSTWYTGEFNGGEFKGRVWNDGIFKNGRFFGSGTYTPIGGYILDGITESNASRFVDSYTNSFYGLWNSGFVSNIKDDFIKNKKVFSNIERGITIKIPTSKTSFDNVLWNSGTFSHPNGTMNNSVWLDGTFKMGKFIKSSFNPWVKRGGDITPSFNLNDDLVNNTGTCIWENGLLEDSEFYISQWKNGKFISGTGFGMIWKNGTSEYMNAYNIFWENGIWRNGNWNGSFINIEEDGSILNEFNKQLLLRGMNYTGTSSTHLWNVFENQESVLDEQGFIIAATPSGPSSIPSLPPVLGLG